MPAQEPFFASTVAVDGRQSPPSGDELGFIKLSRKYLESDEWLSGEVFSSREAWIDIIALANWGTFGRTTSNGTLVVLQRGEFSASVRFLASRWGWKKTAVERFLAKLVRDRRLQKAEKGAENSALFEASNPGHLPGQQPGHLPGHPKTTQSGQMPVVYVIVKYDYYQGSASSTGTVASRTIGTPTGTPTGTATGPKLKQYKTIKSKNTHCGSTADLGESEPLPAGAGVSVPEEQWQAWAEEADNSADVVGSIEPSPEAVVELQEDGPQGNGLVLMLPLDRAPEPTVPATTKAPAFPEEFETLWKAYPKRGGDNPKKGAFQKWQATRKRGASAEELQQATETYALHCRGQLTKNLKERRVIERTGWVKQAETFFGPAEPWRDWLDLDLVAPEPPQQLPAVEVASAWADIDSTCSF